MNSLSYCHFHDALKECFWPEKIQIPCRGSKVPLWQFLNFSKWTRLFLTWYLNFPHSHIWSLIPLHLDIINHLEWNCNYISFERINWQIDTNSSSKRIYHDTRSQNVNVSSLNLTILAQNSRYDTTKNRKKREKSESNVQCSLLLMHCGKFSKKGLTNCILKRIIEG